MAIYLKAFLLPSDGAEMGFIMGQKRTCYATSYPFKLFPDKGLRQLTFEPVTIFYGGNGSGKSTLLNIIAEKLGVKRHSVFGGSAFFPDYLRLCQAQLRGKLPEESQILTSDDVSDHLLHLRSMSQGIDRRREELFEDYLDRKYSSHRLHSLAEYEDWRESYDAKRQTQSRFVRERLMKNPEMFSNGESAMRYFTDRITEQALYLLDEPENSLSVTLQEELAAFLADSARYFGCQLVLATHSPVLLALPGAKIYDLDALPVTAKRWTELANVRAWRDFFRAHEEEFS
ncbi:MAG: AAA family ATPase [Oscillospiraceae bacterium]